MKRCYSSRRGLQKDRIGFVAVGAWTILVVLLGLMVVIPFRVWKNERDMGIAAKMAEAEANAEAERVAAEKMAEEERVAAVKVAEEKRLEAERMAEEKRLETIKNEEVARLEAARIASDRAKTAKTNQFIALELAKVKSAKADAARILLEALAEKDRIKEIREEVIKTREQQVADDCKAEKERKELAELEADLQPVVPAVHSTGSLPKQPVTTREIFRTSSIETDMVCGKCKGTGRCTWPECIGGLVFSPDYRYPYHRHRKTTKCVDCAGTGKCSHCGGTGKEPKRTSL